MSIKTCKTNIKFNMFDRHASKYVSSNLIASKYRIYVQLLFCLNETKLKLDYNTLENENLVQILCRN